ncbi:hypothetical protein Taro_049904, partial [Colocasia esculenta]|nr:hypothetical protein [Colocasia esculenta]
MEAPPLPTFAPSPGSGRTVVDLDADALTHCANFLGLQDLANMAMTCKLFRHAAYSDSMWRRFFRESWPEHFISSHLSGARDLYLARQTAVHQFKFEDPLKLQISAHALPHSHVLLNKNDLILAQGRSQRCFKGHNSPVTSLADKLLGNSSMKMLASGGEDGSVRLWSFNSSGKRQPLAATFHGHERPISFLSVA